MKPLRVCTRHEGQLVRLVVDRPKGNIITAEVIGAMRASLAGLPAAGAVKLVTIEGAGDHFSFGASVEEHRPDMIGRMLPEFHALVRDLLAVPAPTAAVVRGKCLGGGFELALACDFLFASQDATLGVPEISLGVFPPAAAALLPARIGAARAAEAVLTGEAFSAARWCEIGLVTEVVPAAELDQAVERWFAAHLAPRSAAALRHATLAVRGAVRAQAEPRLAELEELYLESLMRTHDAVEGIAAFIEKRPPHWRNA
jgi:cyclohexa-1,5-dienecarbonyl-CoA hydratase